MEGARGEADFNRMRAGALILNAGYQPIKVVSWRKAMILWFQGKVEILEYHNLWVRSPHASFQLPAVIKLKQYIRPYLSLSVRLSRQNVFLRDHHTCQYCQKTFPEKRLTIDHVVPLSKGGRHEWNNVVTACSSCNNKKGDKSPERANMTLHCRPEKPRWLPNRDLDVSEELLPDTWKVYLSAR
jgi:5-methylcytosine-specific restriction endonuclease McrA